MTTDAERMRAHLQAFDLRNLFVDGLGWNHYHAAPLHIAIDGFTYELEAVAEKADFAVFVCGPDADGALAPYPIRRKIEHQVARLVFEHLIIFVDAERSSQVWQWVKREADKPDKYRELSYSAGQSGTAFLQRIEPLVVSLAQELRGVGIAEVASRVKQAMDIERVTRRFYDRFKGELTAFQSFIDGITAQGDREWYASLMLNRMMFVYFIQKQGFLDDDTKYLRNRLEMVRTQAGDGQYQQFYRMFLRRLFHDGLGQPEAERTPELARLLGRVPFLNGGLFDRHELERDNPNISIPDEAFEKVFDFFDAYQWHLDDRPQRDDNEINPDVLGYIFEKYINQKQMGAYYTKEDITGYITRNTVIPFLFDAAKRECPIAFRPNGGVWRLLQDDPDRYIYPAVGHGTAWNYSPDADAERLTDALALPDDIAAGIADVSLRHGWNAPAPDEYALPTETWREVVARRKRYEEVRAKIATGEVHDINDLITLNLDIERFAKDVIDGSEGPELLRAFWHALNSVSVLDPTCGSGAFLFAALNILEPLYTACIDGMRGFLNDLEVSQRPHHPNALSDFRTVLEQLKRHPSERYFILKSIVLNNLYGVDIMEEATEICKLRLFLKLLAQLKRYDQIEPLPDIDFNIRAGNTLVGFTSLDAVRNAMTIMPNGQYRASSDEDNAALECINEEAEIAARAFDQFREQQTALGGEITQADKAELRRRLESLGDTLDSHLAAEYGIQPDDAHAYDAWRTSHQPFHWFVEFYGVMQSGGFDVIVGNPPYVEYRKVRREYTIRGYETEKCGNLYAFVMERCQAISHARSSLSMIVPLSGHSTARMTPLVQTFYNSYGSVHCQTIGSDANPSRLFDGVKFRLAIFIASNYALGTFTSRYMRWYAAERAWLFDRVEYTPIGDFRYKTAIPKVSSLIHLRVLQKLQALGGNWRESDNRDDRVLYHSAPVNWIRAHTYAPYSHSERDGQRLSVELKPLYADHDRKGSFQATFCSSTFFLWWLSNSDCYHLNKPEIRAFPIVTSERLEALSVELEKDMASKTKRRVYNYRTTGRLEYDEFYLKQSKPIIDEIDRVLAEHYGFTDEELDYIINYDIKYRMGR